MNNIFIRFLLKYFDGDLEEAAKLHTEYAELKRNIVSAKADLERGYSVSEFTGEKNLWSDFTNGEGVPFYSSFNEWKEDTNKTLSDWNQELCDIVKKYKQIISFYEATTGISLCFDELDDLLNDGNLKFFYWEPNKNDVSEEQYIMLNKISKMIRSDLDNVKMLKSLYIDLAKQYGEK